MRVFLSYRRKDTEDEADRIRRHFEKSNQGLKLFEYKTSTTAGARWEEEIDEKLAQSDVLVALIGKKWLGLLQDRPPAHDMVRYEIGTALKQRMRVIPLLVAGADVPKPEQLPEDLSELAKCMPIHADVLNDEVLRALEKEICRVKNWVIVSQTSPFTDALRMALEKRRDQLGIVRFPKFELPAKEHHIEYPQLLRKFMRDALHGSWLLTNYPEDQVNKHSESQDRKLIEELLNQKKRMICFESGHNLWARGERVGKGNNPVSVIETNAGDAIEHLVQHMTTHVWRKDDIRHIEIVSVMGPLAANTQERGRKYLEFFGCVQHGMKTDPKTDPYGDVLNTLGTKVLCTTITKPLPTWLAEHCTPEIMEFLRLRKPENNSVHTTFVCGNDDLAVIVYNAVNEMFAADVQKGRVSFVGFDGMPSMEKLKETLEHRAATAKVDFDVMVEVAVGWLEKGEVSPEQPFKVAEREVC